MYLPWSSYAYALYFTEVASYIHSSEAGCILMYALVIIITQIHIAGFFNGLLTDHLSLLTFFYYKTPWLVSGSPSFGCEDIQQEDVIQIETEYSTVRMLSVR